MAFNDSTFSSSMPTLAVDGFASAFPRIFTMRSTAVSSALVATGFLAGLGAGSRASGGSNPGLRVGDIVLHTQTTDTAYPGRVTMHSVIASTANQASTSASTGWAAAYDITLNNSTST